MASKESEPVPLLSLYYLDEVEPKARATFAVAENFFMRGFPSSSDSSSDSSESSVISIQVKCSQQVAYQFSLHVENSF